MTMLWKIKENLYGEELQKWRRKKLLSYAIFGITSWLAILVIQTWEDLQFPARAKKQSCHHKSSRQFRNYRRTSHCRLFSANFALYERGMEHPSAEVTAEKPLGEEILWAGI